MPAAIAIPLITAGVQAGGMYAASRSQAGSNRRATAAQDRSSQEAIALEREKEARRQQEYDREQAEAQKQWEAEQEQKKNSYDLDLQDRMYSRQLTQEQEARRAPYRAAGAAALQNLGQMLGLHFDPAAYAPRAAAAPEIGPSAEDQKALTLLGSLRKGLDPTSQNLGTLITGLNTAGIKAVRARHANNTLDSDDKIVLPSGYITDQIFDVGSPNARWT